MMVSLLSRYSAAISGNSNKKVGRLYSSTLTVRCPPKFVERVQFPKSLPLGMENSPDMLPKLLVKAVFLSIT